MQVRELYGPLLACVTATKSAFEAMVRQHSGTATIQEFITAARSNPEGKEGHTYRYTQCFLACKPSVAANQLWGAFKSAHNNNRQRWDRLGLGPSLAIGWHGSCNKPSGRKRAEVAA